MAKKLAQLIVDLEARSARFEQGIKTAETKANAFGKTMTKLGGTLIGVFSARALLRGMGSMVQAFAVQEDAVTSLRAALEVTGKQGSASLDLLTRHAAELQQVTTKGDEAIIAATASLTQLAVELNAAELARAQSAIIGIADTFLKGDVENAALLVGKSIGSTTNALTRYGIQLDAAASQQQKLAAIVEQSNKFFEVSKARAENVAGATQQLTNAWGDLKEAIGAASAESTGFLGTLRRAVEGVTFLLSTDKFDEYLKINQKVVEAEERLQRLQERGERGGFGIALPFGDKETIESLTTSLAELRRERARLKRDMGGSLGTLEELTGGGGGGGVRHGPRWTLGPPMLVNEQVYGPAASVNTLLDAAIKSSKAYATQINDGAKTFDTSAQIVLSGFDEIARAAGVFRNTTARLVIQGIGAILESFGKSDFLKSLGSGLQHFQSGGVVKGPLGSPQLAVVHAGETVIPRGKSTQPIVVNQSINFNVAAMDALSFGSYLQANKGAVGAAVARAVQDVPGMARMLRG